MSAKPRDLLKSRPGRIAEVLGQVTLKAGHADSQLVLWGANVVTDGTATKFGVSAGEYVLAQAVVSQVAVTAIVVDTGSTTGAGEFRKVLVEAVGDGTVVQTVGAKAASQAAAVLPDGNPANISLGWIEIPASFTPGTTNVVSGMLKQTAYHNGSNT